MAKLRFWAMTVGTTVLIWYAADQSVTTTAEIDLRLEIRPRVPDSMFVEEPDSRSVRLVFRGPNRAVGELRARKDLMRVPLELEPRDSGTYTVDLLEAYRQHMDQFPEGLALVSAAPPAVTVEVDRYVERAVRLAVGEGAELLENWQLDPQSVVATVPESKFSNIPPEGRVITLDVTQWLAEATPGEMHEGSLGVPNHVADVKFIEVRPSTVNLVGKVARPILPLHIKTMPVGVKFNSNELTDYRVKFGVGDDRVVTVELWVKGPAEQIKRIEDDPARHIEGFIRITSQDVSTSLKSGEFVAKKPQFILPPGVHLAREPEELQVRLIPRG